MTSYNPNKTVHKAQYKPHKERMEAMRREIAAGKQPSRHVGLRAQLLDFDFTNCTIDNFRYFVLERESIRTKKEAGEPGPWTEDYILANNNFINLFREDDKTSKFIHKAMAECDSNESAWRTALYGRLINRVDVLNTIFPLESDVLPAHVLDNPMFNGSAYQIHVSVKKGYPTIREGVYHHTPKVLADTYEAMLASDSIDEATHNVNKAYIGGIPFIAFQAILDYTQIIDDRLIDTEPFIGEGAWVIEDHLGANNIEEMISNLDLKRRPHKFDVENFCCEFRKYLTQEQRLKAGKKLSKKYKPNSMGI